MSLIAIGGVSRSGKSSLCQQLADRFLAQGKSVTTFDMDDFVKDVKDVPMIRDRRDWEHPGSINEQRLKKAIDRVDVDIRIVEGIFTFVFPWLLHISDLRLLVEIDEMTFYSRRAKDHRWGPQPPWYVDHVWEANSLLMTGHNAHLTLDGSSPLDYDRIFDSVLKILHQRLER